MRMGINVCVCVIFNGYNFVNTKKSIIFDHNWQNECDVEISETKRPLEQQILV